MSRLLAADALRSDDPDLEAAAAVAGSPNPNLQTAAHPAAATVEAAAWDQPPKGSDALLQVNV